MFGCLACRICLPSRRSLQRHLDGHPQKDTVAELAVCAACGFLAAHTAMLEWHVFVSHVDVARSLVLRRWPRLARRPHPEDCAHCDA